MPPPIELRRAVADDFAYCKRVYLAGMQQILDKLHLDPVSHAIGFARQWDPEQVRLIVLDRIDVGWVQTTTEDGDLYIAQLFVDGPYQRCGVGTDVIHRLFAEAAQERLAVRLSVVKINPAVRLYERLGFRVVQEDERKFSMRRDHKLSDLSHARR